MNFDEILTKFDQILTIYVKNHQVHVKKIQERHFLKIKQIQRQKSSRIWMLNEMLTLLDFGPENPKFVISIPPFSMY